MDGHRGKLDSVGGEPAGADRFRPPSSSCQLVYYSSVKRALVGDAKRKYFEHAGALMTADGTDDHLIKLEGAPAGYKVVVP